MQKINTPFFFQSPLFKKLKIVFLILLVSIWIGAIAKDIHVLGTYANSPGQVGKLSLQWPKDSSIQLGVDRRPTLILFLHPKCAPSRASISELDTLMAKIDGRATVYAVFAQPNGWNEEDIQAQLWKEANSIPGVKVVIDQNGAEAHRFGALTSGHMLAYDEKGTLAFSGGITPTRGRLGTNEGLKSVIDFVKTRKATISSSKIFGCGLFDESHTPQGTQS